MWDIISITWCGGSGQREFEVKLVRVDVCVPAMDAIAAC